MQSQTLSMKYWWLSMDIPLIKMGWSRCTKYDFCLHSEDGARIRGVANQSLDKYGANCKKKLPCFWTTFFLIRHAVPDTVHELTCACQPNITLCKERRWRIFFLLRTCNNIISRLVRRYFGQCWLFFFCSSASS